MNTRNSNPAELVDRYLQAVRFWLPRKHQQDLTAELGEDLRSQIDEREALLCRPLDKAEIGEILKRCGAPMIVASRLGPKRYLIGPVLFPIYEFVLKLVLFWILVPVFTFIVGPVNVANAGGNWQTAVLDTIGDLWSGLFISAGVITLVFAILERTHVEFRLADKWDPGTLPPLAKPERKKSVAHTVSELIFGFLGLIWLLLIPHYPVLILGPAAAFLRAAPLWHTFYVPILLLGVLGLLRAGITLARPQWTWFPPTGELVQAVLTLVLLKFLLNASGQMTNGEWHPFVVATEAARNSVQYIRVAAIVNVSILVCLVCAWFGLCIGMVVQLWQLLGLIRKRVSNAGQPASLHV